MAMPMLTRGDAAQQHNVTVLVLAAGRRLRMVVVAVLPPSEIAMETVLVGQ